MKRIPAISTIMTPFPYSVDVTDTVGAARAKMAQHDIRHLPVTDGDTVVGLVTLRELTRFAGADTAPVGVLDPEQPLQFDLHHRLDRALDAMASGSLDEAAVVMREGRLAGIVTMVDVCRYAAQITREPFVPPDGETAA